MARVSWNQSASMISHLRTYVLTLVFDKQCIPHLLCDSVTLALEARFNGCYADSAHYTMDDV